ncbi:ABC transporter permease [Spirosoma knui]
MSTQNPLPPRWAQKLLSWWAHPDTREDVQGDLLELYAYWVNSVGKRRADWRYSLNALKLVRPFAKPERSTRYTQPFFLHPAMIRNYLTIAWRNLNRNRAFSAINIAGLSIGLATCILISLFVVDELSFDRYNAKADRIVRVVFRGTMNGEKMREANVMPPVAQTLKADYPEVIEATRLRTGGFPRITYGDKTFREGAFTFVDSNFFQVFTLPFLKGDPKTALVRPNTVVITTVLAQKYFGNDDPIGKVLTVKDRQTAYTITGVIDPVPANSHFHFDLFAAMSTLPEAKSTSWIQSNFYTYLVLPDGYDYKRLDAKLPQVAEKYMAPQLRQMMGVSLAEFRKKGNDIGLSLQRLTDIHLHSDMKPETDLEPGGDIRYVYLFGAIAVFMLLLACINFMNLSTAGATKRAKEVGIRKVMGSAKGKLVGQFLAESTLLTALSLVLALGIVWLALPYLNELSGKALRLNFLQTPWLLPVLVLFGVLVGLLAGSYPAFFLSSFRPIAVLKGNVTAGQFRPGSSFTVRGGLVVFQFFVSFTLLVGTTVVYQQLRYIQNTKLGYDKDQVLVLHGTGALGKNEDVFRRQLLKDARVQNASISAYLPSGPTYMSMFSLYPEAHNEQVRRIILYGIDSNYLPTLGMKVVAGRNFSPSFGTDSMGVLINETAARLFGWGNDAIGRTLINPNNEGIETKYQVVGVVRDFHFRSLHEQIAPLAMTLRGNSGSIIVKTKTKDIESLLAYAKTQWATFSTDEPFVYSFLDERYQTTYEAELKTGRILGIFAGLTIFIACLGLFGLATFTAEQRTKEIGVRKVLGASVPNIVALLSKDFLKPVLLAILIASPIAWYVTDLWLQNFAYKIDIEWWMFVLAGVLAISIALLTVSFQSIKAALMNPIKSLRSE